MIRIEKIKLADMTIEEADMKKETEKAKAEDKLKDRLGA